MIEKKSPQTKSKTEIKDNSNRILSGDEISLTYNNEQLTQLYIPSIAPLQLLLKDTKKLIMNHRILTHYVLWIP